jgi:hypothetical protein
MENNILLQLDTSQDRQPTLDEIAEAVLAITGISAQKMRSDKKTAQPIIDARHVFTSLALDLKHDRGQVADYVNLERSTTYHCQWRKKTSYR